MIPYYEHPTFTFFGFSSRNWQWHLDSPPGWSTHLHQHVEIAYMEKGEADITIENEAYHLYEGDIAVIFPHCSHSYRIAVAPEEPHNLQGVCFLPALIGDYTEEFISCLPAKPVLRREEIDEELLYPLTKLKHTLWNDEPRAKVYLQLFLFFLWPWLDTRADTRQRQDDTLHRILRYVMENAHRPLQAKEVASAMEISGSYLARFFSSHLHMGFNEYVNLLRVRMAEDRLRDSKKTVTDIMNEVGFESQSTFNRAFRRVHGISPREYRNQACLFDKASRKGDEDA